jgi:molybdenum cofactor biosynthesis protein B
LVSLKVALFRVAVSRSQADDTSGEFLVSALTAAGHHLHERKILRDDRYAIRAQVATWIADTDVHGVLITGGTGFTGRDSTPEAVLPLLDKEMPGFGELFRAVSFEEIGTSSLQSRAFAGLSNQTFVFALPGSTSACRTGWDKLLRAQLDARTRPCNLVGLIPRLGER